MNSCHVEMVGHASIMLHSGGKTLLTDPWYVDPVSCNTLFHWPPLISDPPEIAARTDAIWISHNHSDHFDAATLQSFPRSTPIYIGDYEDKSFLALFDGLGFDVAEVPFQRRFNIPGTRFVISLIESDYKESASFDSSIIVETPEYTLFNNNDCFLKEDKYDWVYDNYAIDYGFLGYSPASFFPICFEYPQEEKDRLLSETAERKYADFTSAVAKLKPRISVPFAMGMRFLHESMLWQNISFNSAPEAVARVREMGFQGEMLQPGDCITTGGVERPVSTPYEKDEEPGLIAAHAATKREWINGLWASEPPAKETLAEDFRAYLRDLWQRGREHYPGAAEYVIVFEIEGAQTDHFWLDLKAGPDAMIQPGEPEYFDIKYRYLDRLLQIRLDGGIDWDDLNFANRLTVWQNRYPTEFYAMLRFEGDPRLGGMSGSVPFNAHDPIA